MAALALEWLNLILRWAHLIVGIGWIGTSFYFIALDLSLRRRESMPEGVYGTAWEVHGGGFYHVEKYLVAPKTLPPDLVWYKWEAYLTWVTGFALLVVQYYFNPSAYLISPAVLPLLPSQAVVISLMSLAAGWFVYDALCRSAIGRHTTTLAVAVFVLIVAAAFIVSHTFSARGALIHVGAIIGTIMAVNVFGVIIPNQKKITAALLAGRSPDPSLGAVSKQRSVHNNYLTLPVLILMVSAHYPMLGSTGATWLVIALILVMGAGARHILNRHDAGDPFHKIWWAFPVTGVALAAAIYLTAPRSDPTLADLEVSDGEVLMIVARHCVSCHSNRPAHEGFDAPPQGVILVSIDDVRTHAEQILAQAVNGDAMPLGNETTMTEDERRRLGAFLLNQ
ncbi:MAG: urate hydroxylase PuuD [Hyphomicrobiales bacterium]|nr:urate hydroxylase PuuD [Hyphomicrobiales bacterium]